MLGVYEVKYPALERVMELIELLIVCHPQGFGVLLGNVSPPDSLLVHAMMNARREPLPSDFKATARNLESESERIIFDFEYFENSVKLAGGWGHINAVTKEFKSSDKRHWGVVKDYVKFVSNAVSRYQSKLSYVAKKHKISPRTVTRYRKEFAYNLAKMLLV